METIRKNGMLIPLVLIISLFFLWGLSYGLLDVLNKHFQESLHISKSRSGLLQAAYFGAYFIMALPAGRFMQRNGYKRAILLGLLVYALGACLFYPAAGARSFTFFLVALFVLASGLAFLETAANPFMTILGNPEQAAFRLNLAQSFNGVGSFIGPVIGGAIFFGAATMNVQWVYFAIAAMVIVVAVLIRITEMPEPLLEKKDSSITLTEVWNSSAVFRNAVVAQFFYVAAQVGVAAYFINYCTEKGLGISNSDAAYYLSLAMVLFTVGRFTGSAILKRVEPNRLLGTYALVNILLCVVVMISSGMVGIWALIIMFFFESILFPTIFAIGIRGLGDKTKLASSLMVMSIVGGAIVPYFMGWVADHYTTAMSYSIPLACFLVVSWFGFKGARP